jgi:hypothetical protein
MWRLIKSWEAFAEPPEAAAAERHDRFGRFKLCSLVQRPFEAVRADAELHAHNILARKLHAP